MNAALAELLLGGGEWAGAGGGDHGGGSGASPHHASHTVVGGRVSDGPALTPSLRAEVERARSRPSGFASLRNLVGEARAALAVEPYTTDLRDPQPAAATKRQRGQGARRRLPRGCDAGRTAAAGEEGGGGERDRATGRGHRNTPTVRAGGV
eukprot:1225694-Pleurochrysis_carterae.AAC.1